MLLRLIVYSGFAFLCFFIIAVSVGAGCLAALKTFWKKELDNGAKLAFFIAAGQVLEKETDKKDTEKSGE